MTSFDPTWSTPGLPTAPDPGQQSGMTFVQSSPLGGSAPVEVVPEPRSERRDLILTGILFVAALVAGGASLLPWRDYAYRYGVHIQETGWVGPNGSLGRGWLTVICAVVIAVSGVLIAAERVRAGRILAALSGSVLILLAIGEWGLGAGDSRSGPGTGIWVELLVGVIVVISVGVLGPPNSSYAESPPH